MIKIKRVGRIDKEKSSSKLEVEWEADGKTRTTVFIDADEHLQMEDGEETFLKKLKLNYIKRKALDEKDKIYVKLKKVNKELTKFKDKEI